MSDEPGGGTAAASRHEGTASDEKPDAAAAKPAGSKPGEPKATEPKEQAPAGPKAGLDAVSTTLAGSFATVTAVLGALGAKAGGLDRMLRNHPGISVLAFGLVVGAIGLAGVARSALVPSVRRQRRILLAGTIAFGVGLLLATTLAVKTPSDRDRPSVAAFVDPETSNLNVTVKANGLASDDRIQISVHGLYPAQLISSATRDAVVSSPVPPPAGEETSEDVAEEPPSTEEDEDRRTIARDPASLYESTLGPQSDGSIDVSLKIPLPAGTFDRVAIAARSVPEEADSALASGDDCRRSSDEGEGCLVLALAPRSIRPRLNATWERDGDHNVFSLDIRAHDVDYNAGVSVSVVGYAEGEVPIEPDLYSTLLPPDSKGEVEATATVPVGGDVASVCAAAVIASPTNPNQDYHVLVTDGPRCPPQVIKPLTAWTHSDVPEQARSSGPE